MKIEYWHSEESFDLPFGFTCEFVVILTCELNEENPRSIDIPEYRIYNINMYDNDEGSFSPPREYYDLAVNAIKSHILYLLYTADARDKLEDKIWEEQE